MPQTQQSLDDTGTTDDTSDDTTGPFEPHPADPQPDLGEIQNFVQQSARIPFLGLEEQSDAEYPDDVNEHHPAKSDNPRTFSDIIRLLPEAHTGELRAVNEYVNDDGTVDTDAINDTINTDKLSFDPDDVSHADKYDAITGYKDIVDDRRKALHALGFDVRYRWQIATSSYTIINPQDAYWPAYRAFKSHGETDVFGWLDYHAYGGDVDIYIFFKDQTFEHPSDDRDTPIYIGLQTGYDFSGGRAMDVTLFGYDPLNNVRFYNIGPRRSRKHIGEPNNPDHERDNGRIPIKEWWENEYENLMTWTDDLVNDVKEASVTTIDFTEFEFGIEDFYRYLSIPDSYIEETDNGIGAIKRAKRHSPDNTTFSMWTLFYALTTTLEKEFQGDSHTSAAFKTYADIGTRILRSPFKTIRNAKEEHDYQQSQADAEEQSKREQAIDGTAGFDEQTNLTDLDGIGTEDELNLVEKREIANQKQEQLFNYN